MCFGINYHCARGGMADCCLIRDDLTKARGWFAIQQNHFDHMYIYDTVECQNIVISDD
jgi:hypothetical protein